MNPFGGNQLFGRRKFTIALLALLLSCLLALLGKIDGTAWTTAVGLTLGLYGAANVASKGKNNGT